MATAKKRKPDLRRIRTSKTYNLPEIAELMDRDIATIRAWVKNGLPLLSVQKPVLVSGKALKDWLQQVWASKKRTCQADELFCFKCRKPRKAMPGSVRIVRRNEKTVSVKGRCAVCNTRMNQTRSLSKLPELQVTFDAPKPQMPSISGHGNASDRHTLRPQANMSSRWAGDNGKCR